VQHFLPLSFEFCAKIKEAMQQRNHHFSFTISINSTLQHVWQTVTDVDTWHVWDTELVSATMHQPFALNAKGNLVPKKGPKLKFYIAELTPLKSYTINTVMPIGQLVIKRTIQQKGNEVLFTDDIAFTGALKFLFGFVLGSKFKKVLPTVMHNFKSFAETKLNT
jgi:hypothetical protein